MKPYKIKKSDIDKKGKGLYATRDIKEGEKIIDYIFKHLFCPIFSCVFLLQSQFAKKLLLFELHDLY